VKKDCGFCPGDSGLVETLRGMMGKGTTRTKREEAL